MQPSITLARIRLHLHRRAAVAWLVVALSSGAAGYLAAGTRHPTRITAAAPPVTAPNPAPTRAVSTGGRLPPNSRGITVPLPDAAPELHVGDRLDLIAAAATGSLEEPASAVGSASATVVAGAVPVVDVRPGAITVAVPHDLAPAVAAAVTSAAVTVALVPPE